MQTFEREAWAGTVADETLDIGTVLGLDTHGGVNAELVRALSGEHAGGIEFVEESLATEVAKDASLESRLHLPIQSTKPSRPKMLRNTANKPIAVRLGTLGRTNRGCREPCMWGLLPV